MKKYLTPDMELMRFNETIVTTASGDPVENWTNAADAARVDWKGSNMQAIDALGFKY